MIYLRRMRELIALLLMAGPLLAQADLFETRSHLGLGEIDDAFIWMDRAVDGRDPMMMPIKTFPFFDPIRADPRYLALLRKMNLEP